MNTRVNVLRWIGTGMIVGLLALLAAANVHAQDPAVAELVAAPAYGLASLAIHCETGILEEGDPFASPDHVDAACPGLAAPKIESIEVTGNVSWVSVLASDEPELHVYVKRDGVWERFPYVSGPDAGTLYMLEQERAFMEQQNPGAAPASPSASADLSSGRYTVDTEAEFLDLIETENAYEALHNATVIAAPASPSASADLSSSRHTVDTDADFLSLLETENAYEERFNPGATPAAASPSTSADLNSVPYTVDTEADFLSLLDTESLSLGWTGPAPQPGATATRISVDVNDPAFLSMIEQENLGLGLVDPTFQPAPGSRAAGGIPVASPSGGETSSIDGREHEIDGASGSALNTRADLVSALFERSWTTNAAGEDLAREAK
jgi:hypothetical protein